MTDPSLLFDDLLDESHAFPPHDDLAAQAYVTPDLYAAGNADRDKL